MGRGSNQSIKAARMTRSQAALDNFTAAVALGGDQKRKRGGYRRVKGNKLYDHQKQCYLSVTAVCAQLGIKVRLMTEREQASEYSTYHGERFTAGGFFQAPNIIALRYENLSTLVHELVHAVDYKLGGNQWEYELTTRSQECELVACAAGDMIMAELLRHKPQHSEYAMKQGGSLTLLDKNKDRITAIYELIMESILQQKTDTTSALIS